MTFVHRPPYGFDRGPPGRVLPCGHRGAPTYGECGACPRCGGCYPEFLSGTKCPDGYLWP
jgi:hypothetical protein